MRTLADVFPARSGGYWGVGEGSSDVDALAIRNGDVGAAGKIDTHKLPLRGFTAREFAKAQVRRGDVILTSSGNCGNTAFIDSDPGVPTVATNFVRILRADPEIANAKYAFHFLRSPEFVQALAPHVRGATIKNLSVESAFRNIEIPLPPLAEQKRIAMILDRADAIRTKRVQVLQRLDDLRESVFKSCFGDPMGQPSQADRKMLIEWVDPSRPITYGILKPGPDIEGGVPYVRVADMQNRGIDLQQIRRTSPGIAASYRRSMLREGDLLMSIRGHVGRFAVVPPSLHGANITQDTARLALVEPRLGAYVRAAMESPSVQTWMMQRTKGAAVRGINLSDLKQLPLIQPPMEQMLAFGRAVNSLDATSQLVRDACCADKELFESLQHRAFRGEL